MIIIKNQWKSLINLFDRLFNHDLWLIYWFFWAFLAPRPINILVKLVLVDFSRPLHYFYHHPPLNLFFLPELNALTSFILFVVAPTILLEEQSECEIAASFSIHANITALKLDEIESIVGLL